MSLLGIDIGPMEIVAGVALLLAVAGRIVTRRKPTIEPTIEQRRRAMHVVNAESERRERVRVSDIHRAYDHDGAPHHWH